MSNLNNLFINIVATANVKQRELELQSNTSEEPKPQVVTEPVTRSEEEE